MRPVARDVLAVALTIAAGPALAQRAPAAVRIAAPTPTLRPESFYLRSGVCSSGTRAGRACVGADLTVEADVSDPAVTRAEVTVNDTSGVVPVRDGRAVATTDWVEGNNRVSVAVRSGGRVVRDSMTRFVGAAQPALRIRAVWSWPGERPVVRVITPSGGGSEETGDEAGVRWDGAVSEPGRYRIVLLRPGDGADARAALARPFEVEDLLGSLAAVDEELSRATGRRRTVLLAERRETLHNLDARAAPAATAGGATLVVTLYAGSSAEQRWAFRVGARDVGEREVGSFLVTESMLVRRSAP